MPDLPPRQLITTLFGLYARDEDNWLSVASLVRLMGDLGVDSAAVRSSISRLKRRDTVRSLKRDGVAGYALSPAALEVIREGDVRIFHRKRASLDDGWLLVVFSIPESERDKRHALRSALAQLGFGTAAPGVWVAPANLYDESARTLHRLGMTDYIDMFSGEHLGFGELRTKVAHWWDLGGLDELYRQFCGEYGGVRARRRRTGQPPQQAFAQYVPMLTQWRRLPYLDPGLPLELLPRNWHGTKAEELFAELDAALRSPAHDHARGATG